MPTTSCQRASTSPRSSGSAAHGRVDLVERVVRRRAVDRLAQRAPRRSPARRRRAPLLHPPRQAVERAGQRAPHQRPRGPPRRPRASSSHARHGRQRRRREAPVVELGLRARRAAARRRARAREPSRPGARRPRRRPRAATRSRTSDRAVPRSARGLEELPGHGVGVARGRGHEQPGVRRGQQLARRAPGWPPPPSRCPASRAARARSAGPASGPARARPGRRAPRSCGSCRAGCDRPRTTAGRPGGTRARARGSSAAGPRPDSPTRPTRLLTSVDLPAPVEPPTTMSSGASMLRRRGSR